MRIKGFFWFLTTILTVICIYQLSFTGVANSVEAEAEKEATKKVAELKKEAFANNNGIGTIELGNNEKKKIDFNDGDAEDVAKSIFINKILREKSATEVYPLLGFTFKEVKSWSLSLGLDLVGGMSVTMAVDEPLYIKSKVQNQNDPTFNIPYEKAYNKYNNNSSLDFIDLFVSEFQKENGDMQLNFMFGYPTQVSNEQVIKSLREEITNSMDKVEKVLKTRIDQFGVASPNIQKDVANNRIYIELPGVQDTAAAKKIIGKTANLEFRLEANSRTSPLRKERFEFKEDQMRTAFLERAVIVSGDRVTNANTGFDENGMSQVNITLDMQGGRAMQKATSGNIGRSLTPCHS